MINEDDKVILEFDLPDFTRDEIKVDISEDSISIDAGNKVENKIEEDDYSGFEKSEKTFSYSSSLPSVKKDEAEIEFVGGKLKISIPKK